MEDVYVSPAIIIDLFNDTKKEVGNNIVTSRDYQKLREGWIAACHVTAYSAAYQEDIHWLMPNPVAHSMPDFYSFVRKNIDNERYKEVVNYEIEVFERRDNSESLFSAVERKLKSWSAPKTSIVCYCWLPQATIHLVRLHRSLIKLNPKVLEIFVLTDFGGRGQLESVQVYPNSFRMPVPTNLPKSYYEPYQFVSKKRALKDVDGGVYKINSEMIISRVAD